MSALLLMPIIIETMMSECILHAIMEACLLLLQIVIVEGKLGPIPWIPTIIHTSVASLLPASVPPDAPAYVTRKIRQELHESWIGKVTRKLRVVTDGMTDRSGTKSRLGLPGMRNNKPRTNTFMAAPRRQCRALANRRMARGMKLVSITCMAASGTRETVAFDSDSKQVAMDNCLSRRLTTSGRDFVPGTIQKCNVAVSGVGGQNKMQDQGDRVVDI
jgi:hypothetical protein